LPEFNKEFGLVFVNRALTAAALIAGTVLASLPASAVIVTFSTFSSQTTKSNFDFVNSGMAGNRANDATFFSITKPGDKSSGAVLVQFSFLQANFGNAVQNVIASLTLAGAIATGAPVEASDHKKGTQFNQPILSETFSFTSTTDIKVDDKIFLAGSNLLSGVVDGAVLSGKFAGTSGSVAASTLDGAAITYTSDFLDFTNTVDRDLAFALTAAKTPFGANTIKPKKGQTANTTLNSFRAVIGGQFSSDPAPIITVVEPTNIALGVIGVSMIGFAIRRKRALAA